MSRDGKGTIADATELMKEKGIARNRAGNAASKKVLLGLSGGVDSAVSAYLLKEKGYEVIGGWLNMWGEDEEENIGRIDAELVAQTVGIEFATRDVREAFNDEVISYFTAEYTAGRTPNPCVYCNRFLKFSALVEWADELGAEYIATGHYSKIIYNKESGRYEVHSPADVKKDQGYMLAMLSQEQLGRLLTPLADVGSKDEVRQIGEQAGLHVAKKKDSQEICFVDGTYLEFLEEKGIKGKSGFFILDGEKKSAHEGIEKYTIGQRKGLGSFGKKVFVTQIDPNLGNVFLGSNDDLFRNRLTARGLNYVSLPEGAELGKCLAKIRYAAAAESCEVILRGDGVIEVIFEKMQRAITPGQIIVFYDDQRVLASATID